MEKCTKLVVGEDGAIQGEGAAARRMARQGPQRIGSGACWGYWNKRQRDHGEPYSPGGISGLQDEIRKAIITGNETK